MSGMSFHEPTTDDIRDAYIDTMGKCGFSESEAGAEFDRWLKRIRAAHWDEGLAYAAAHLDTIGRDPIPWSDNPYGVR